MKQKKSDIKRIVNKIIDTPNLINRWNETGLLDDVPKDKQEEISKLLNDGAMFILTKYDYDIDKNSEFVVGNLFPFIRMAWDKGKIITNTEIENVISIIEEAADEVKRLEIEHPANDIDWAMEILVMRVENYISGGING